MFIVTAWEHGLSLAGTAATSRNKRRACKICLILNRWARNADEPLTFTVEVS